MSDRKAPVLEPEWEGSAPRRGSAGTIQGLWEYCKRNPRAVTGILLFFLAVGFPFVIAGGANVLIAVAFACLACAVALAPDESRSAGSMVALLPFAFLCLVAEGIALALALGLQGNPFALDGWWAWLAWVAMVGPWAVVSIRRGGSFRVVAEDRAAAAGLAAMIAFGVAAAIWIPIEDWSRIQSTHTDLVRHVVMMKGVLDAGGLQYSNATSFSAYPRGLSAFVGIVWSASGQGTFTRAFFSFSGVLWIMVALLLSALISIGSRLARAIGLKAWPGQVVVPVLVAAAFVNGMWVTVMWPRGFATSIVGGLCIAVVCLVALPGGFDKRLGALMGAIAIVLVAAHTWSLVAIPVGCVIILWLMLWLRESKPRWPAIVLTALATALVGVACLPPMLTRTGAASAVELLKTPGASGLAWPGAWWALALLAAVFMVRTAWRYGLRVWSSTWLVLAVAIVVVTAGAWLLSGATLRAPSYYVLKLVWTGSVIVLPVALVGAVWVISRIVQRAAEAPSPSVRLGVMALVVGTIVIVGAVVAGQVAGQGLRVARFWWPRAAPSYQNAVNAQLEGSSLVRSRPDGVMVWGISPVFKFPLFPDYATDRDLDHLTLEGLSWFWPDRLPDAYPIPSERLACEYLRQHPSALRITGSAPESGPAWLIASGCPESVVKSNEWHRISVPPEWSKGVWSEESPPEHITFEQFRKESQAKIDARKGASR